MKVSIDALVHDVRPRYKGRGPLVGFDGVAFCGLHFVIDRQMGLFHQATKADDDAVITCMYCIVKPHG
jgi:hypothetical protein